MKLSPRMEQVAALVVRGRSDKAIARELGLSEGTIEQYLNRISQRLPGPGRPREKILRREAESRPTAA